MCPPTRALDFRQPTIYQTIQDRAEDSAGNPCDVADDVAAMAGQRLLLRARKTAQAQPTPSVTIATSINGDIHKSKLLDLLEPLIY
jgi:hypothetical protein